MAELQKTVFLLLRYCGNPTKRESINIGLVALSAEPDADFAEVRFAQNWRRLLCFDPIADIEELQGIEREIRLDLRDPLRRAELLKRAGDAYSNNIRMDLLKGCLSESPAMEIDKLASLYLETPSDRAKREPTGRQRIVQVMRDELQKAGVLEMMRTDVPVAEFTRPGDPLKLDFAYAAGSDLKFLHAVSPAQRVESGMVLAARFPQIAAGIKEKRGARAWLTAIVDDELPRRDEVNFALDMMRDAGITIVPTAEMPRIAEGIRLEFGSTL